MCVDVWKASLELIVEPVSKVAFACREKWIFVLFLVGGILLRVCKRSSNKLEGYLFVVAQDGMLI